MSARMPWFRMYADFLNDPKMIALAFDDQRHFIGVLALKCDGALDDVADGDLLDRIVAQRLWVDQSIIRDVKRRLVASGLIDANWQPLAWDRRQMRSDKDLTGAERQRRYRESRNSNALRNAPSNASVTRLDTEIDTETDKEEPKHTYADAPVCMSESPPKSTAKPTTTCPHEKIVEIYHETLPALPRVREFGEPSRRTLKARWAEAKDRQNLDWWREFFGYVGRCPFLVGQVSDFRATLGWLIGPKNFAKVLNGQYEATPGGVRKHPPPAHRTASEMRQEATRRAAREFAAGGRDA